MAKRPKGTPRIDIGTCFAVPEDGDRFSACQVIGHHESGGHEAIALDWLGDAMPTLKDLDGVSVLILNHHSWSDSPQRLIVSDAPPGEFVPIGVREPLTTFDEEPRSYGSWLGLSGRILTELWWNEVVPEAERRAYKDARKHRREPITIEFAGASHERERGLSGARVGGEDAVFPAEPDQKLDWSAFDAFGMMGLIEYTGTDATVLDYFRGRVLMQTLHWHDHGRSTIDLTGTGIGRLVLEVGDGPLEVRVPAEIEFISLLGYRDQKVTVHHEGEGHGLHLLLHDLEDTAPPPVVGLEALSFLSLMTPKELTLGELGYPALERLTVRSDGGAITDLEALAELQDLRRLRVTECYEMQPEAFPEPSALPKLDSVEFHSLRKSHAAVLKKRLKGVATVKIKGAKSDAWLAANAGNPFNNWVDESQKLGKAACKIYKQAYGKVTKLAADDKDTYHQLMVDFVRAFNRLGTKHALDTIHREHIFSAFFELASASPVEATKTELATWFDEDREF